MNLDRLLYGRKAVAQRQNQRNVPVYVWRRAEQHGNRVVVVAQVGNRNTFRREHIFVCRSRLQHHAVRGRFHIVNCKLERRVLAVLVNGEFRRQIDKIRRVRHGGNLHRNGCLRRRARCVLHGIQERVGAVEISDRRIKNLVAVHCRRTMEPVFAFLKGKRFRIGYFGVDIAVVAQHVDVHAAVLGNRRFIVHGTRRVVDVVHCHGNLSGRSAAVSVRNRIAEFIGARIILRRRVFDHAEHDHRRAVCRRSHGIDGQLVPVGRIGVVGQHIDANFRILVDFIPRVGCGQRRIIYGLNGNVKRVAHRLVRFIRDRDRYGDRSAETVGRRRDIQTDFFRSLIEYHGW